MSELEHHIVPVNGLNLHVVQAGPPDGPLVILLHGFPEFWYAWRKQIGFLAEQGYRVWAPDQRGYNLSDKPASIADYGLDRLAADVKGLIEAAGRSKALLVGHDWGAIVAWWTASVHPTFIERLVVLNVPHPALASRIARRSPTQLLKSWYIFFFQLPLLPEKMFKRRNWSLGTNSLVKSSRRGTFSESDLNEYRRAWAQPGAIGSMINYYRAAVRFQPAKLPATFRLSMPVMILWGVKDAFLNSVGASTSTEICQDVRLVYFPKATHWLQHEEGDRVNGLLHEFFHQPE